MALPILRPLIGMDKMEITAWSRKIGAFETSILPYRDCCSIRSPRPILNARSQELLRYSEKMALPEAVTEALAAATGVAIWLNVRGLPVLAVPDHFATTSGRSRRSTKRTRRCASTNW